MGKKIKRKLLINRTAVLLTSMLVLNVVGIGYGLWDNGIDMLTSVFTGELGVRFDENRADLSKYNNGGLIISRPDDLTIQVDGIIQLEPRKVVTETGEAVITTAEYDEYEEILDFNIVNNGDIPVVLKKQKIINKNEELKLDIIAEAEEAGEQTFTKSNPQLHIQAGEGEHYFEIEFEFEQKR